MEGMSRNKWKFVKRTILNQLWQSNRRTAYEAIFISSNPQVLDCRFLDVLVLIIKGFYCIKIIKDFLPILLLFRLIESL